MLGAQYKRWKFISMHIDEFSFVVHYVCLSLVMYLSFTSQATAQTEASFWARKKLEFRAWTCHYKQNTHVSTCSIFCREDTGNYYCMPVVACRLVLPWNMCKKLLMVLCQSSRMGNITYCSVVNSGAYLPKMSFVCLFVCLFHIHICIFAHIYYLIYLICTCY